MKHYQNYESEFAAFLRQMKQEHPEIDRHQRDGRKLLWDKPPLPPDQMKLAINSEVKLKPYVYE